MKGIKEITSEVASHYTCDPLTGILVRAIAKKWAKKGDIITCTDDRGYLVVTVDWVQYKAHRICYFLYHNEQPNIIDHINGNISDNRKCNLRSCTQSQNSMNQKMMKNNTSGVCGISQYKNSDKWVARITVNRRSIYLGSFKEKIDAKNARKIAELKYFGEFRNNKKVIL